MTDLSIADLAKIESQLALIEAQSYPPLGLFRCRRVESINGRKVTAVSTRSGRGTSGKGYRTIWFVDGTQTPRAQVAVTVLKTKDQA
ncbi:MAG: hypothetical protein RBU21_02885 [FCB group bacterium]|jgi:hypothetical protein|nr:hypothetical protein [FCB group bacterium]